MNILYTGSHSTAVLKDVIDNSDQSVISDATVEFTLFEEDGITEVTGQVWPLLLVPTDPGTYAGTIDATVDVKHNWMYDGFCKATEPGGIVMEIHCDMIGKDRACCE